MLAVLDDLGLRERLATLRQQPAWRGKPLPAQVRRFAGVASGRKALLAGAMAAALRPHQVPPPLTALLDQVELALRGERPPTRRSGTTSSG